MEWNFGFLKFGLANVPILDFLRLLGSNEALQIRLARQSLTLSGTGQGIFTLMFLLDQILSADFFSKISNSFAGENWD